MINWLEIDKSHGDRVKYDDCDLNKFSFPLTNQ